MSLVADVRYIIDVDKISVCILTKNNERTLRRCLAPLLDFDEVLILDTGSEDDTLSILAENSKIRVLHQAGIDNFGKSRNRLAEEARNDWILMVDADEVLSEPLVREIRDLPDDPHRVYGILRVNHYRGRPVRACGWYPEYCNRLYHRRTTQWKERIVHEILLVPDNAVEIRLQQEMSHFSCEGAGQLARKYLWYAELFADDYAGRRRTSILEAIVRGSWTFLRCYLLRHGFLYGRDGFIISWLAAFGSFMKYAVLQEKNEKRQRDLVEKPDRNTL